MTLEVNLCTRENLPKWCKKKKREGTGLGGAYLGHIGCYRPGDDVVCLGIEYFWKLWLSYEDDRVLIEEVIKVLCHEEDHRAIYQTTKSIKTTLSFDFVFTALYDYKKNREWFMIGGNIDYWKPMKWESLKERREFLQKTLGFTLEKK